MSDPATLSIIGNIGHLVIDAPPVNALGVDVRRAIVEGVTRLAADPAVAAIILSCGGRTFFAGADISEFGKPFADPDLNEVVAALEECDKIVVAAIHGTALGGGLEVALGAHYRIALPSAQLGFPEVKLGLIPGAGGTQRAPRLAGIAPSLALITSGRSIKAPEALELGLIDRIAQGDDLIPAALDYAAELLAQQVGPRRASTLAVRNDCARERVEAVAQTGDAAAARAGAEALLLSLDGSFTDGLTGERAIFDRLMGGAESRALRHIFFAEREAGKLIGLAAGTKPGVVKSVGIIGAGTMGGGIAMTFLNAGIPVTLVEVREEALDRGLTTIRRNYEATAKKGRLTMEEVEARMALITPMLDFDALAAADLVIEAAFESMAVKKDIFTRLDAIAKPGALLATNTSFLDVDEIAAATARPQDVLGLHFFSPANVMKLLEVVRGARTSDQTLATAMALAKKLGKTAVVSRVCHGFIANRIMDVRRIAAETLLLEGIDVARIDGALTDYGFPMGQFAMFDLVGLDVMGRDSDDRTLMGDFVAAGRLGQKSGGGYYDYDDKRRPSPSGMAARIIADHAAYKGVSPAPAPASFLPPLLYPVVNEAAKLIDEGIVQRASDIDVALIAGYGWPALTGGPMLWADEQGLGDIVGWLDAAGLSVAASLREAARSGKALHQIRSA